MTQKSCAVGMRNANPGNHLNSCIRMKLTDPDWFIDWLIIIISGSSVIPSVKLNVKISNRMIYYNNIHWANDQTAFSFHISWWVSIDHESVQIFKMFSLSPLPSLLTPCLFPENTDKVDKVRNLGTRVKNNKFCDGDCTVHVQELTVVPNVEHRPTRSSSLTLWQRGQKEETAWERGWNIWLIRDWTELCWAFQVLFNLCPTRKLTGYNSHISRQSWTRYSTEIF